MAAISRNNMLIFSLALNGYHLLYRKHIRSHKIYADSLGCDYQCVTRPFISHLGVECCWLKLYLMQAAFRAGYQNVLFLDADTMVAQDAPDIREQLQANFSIYMAKGYSGRFNSGVLLMRKHKTSLQFLQKVIDSQFSTLDKRDDVGWGESSYIIAAARGNAQVCRLSHRWNNTYDLSGGDYIRHFNHGPMRQQRLTRLLHKAVSLCSRVYFKLSLLFTGLCTRGKIKQTQQQELARIQSLYPEFAPKPQTDTYPKEAHTQG